MRMKLLPNKQYGGKPKPQKNVIFTSTQSDPGEMLSRSSSHVMNLKLYHIPKLNRSNPK